MKTKVGWGMKSRNGTGTRSSYYYLCNFSTPLATALVPRLFRRSEPGKSGIREHLATKDWPTFCFRSGQYLLALRMHCRSRKPPLGSSYRTDVATRLLTNMAALSFGFDVTINVTCFVPLRVLIFSTWRHAPRDIFIQSSYFIEINDGSARTIEHPEKTPVLEKATIKDAFDLEKLGASGWFWSVCRSIGQKTISRRRS